MSDMKQKWEKPEIEHGKMTKYNYIVQYPENFIMGMNFDIGEFTYINAEYGVSIHNEVQVGSHCVIYSNSTIDNKKGPVVLQKNCKIGTHSTIMPGVTIGENSIIAAYSFVTKNIPSDEIWEGIPAKFKKKLTE
jgi:acetyltransferase-like isoleucine patch superfamily enzyme|tara:strand:+ start:39 stop:440 length:402 start_codon:yes stop_codon:yes gene_type:complete